MTEKNDGIGTLHDMSDAEFRAALSRVSDWVSRYRQEAGNLPVLSRITPGQIERALPPAAPQQGEPIDNWLKDLDEIIVPGITHWNHPGFLAYFSITGSGPGILAELIASAINANGMLWKTSPALTELEQVVLRWHAQALGLPIDWFGMITDTASTSTLVALIAAREAAGLNVREEGLSGKPPLVLYCSQEAHSSIDKAGIVMGAGTQGIRRIASDENYRMRMDELEKSIQRDLADKKLPFAVVATVGTTSATAVDPVPEMAALCRKYKLWLHVDAAYAGTAAIASEFRWALKGCDQADSLVTNPHKWMFTPIDCSTLFTRRPEVFRSAFSLIPEYLRAQVGGTIDLMDYSFQLGRRFRAIKLWFVYRYLGTEGIAARIRQHVGMARTFAEWVDANPELERLASVDFSVVNFRIHPRGIDDESELERINKAALEEINAAGPVFLSHTKLHDRFCMHLAIGNLQTTMDRVHTAYDLVCKAAKNY